MDAERAYFDAEWDRYCRQQMQHLCDEHGIDSSKIDPAVANSTTSTVMEMDYSDLEARVLALMAEEVVVPYPLMIQTMEMLPETNKDGHPFILDGTTMKKNGFMGIWGDWLMHPKTLEWLREQMGQ